MWRFLTTTALISLLQTNLLAQDAMQYSDPVGTHAIWANAMTCNSCHQSNPTTFDATVQGLSADRYVNLVYASQFSDPSVLGNSSSAIRMGNVTFVQLTNDLVRSHLPIDTEPAMMVSAVQTDSDLLKRGDVVLAVNSIPVNEYAKIQQSVEVDREKPASLLLIRSGKKMQAEVNASFLARPEQPYLIGVQVESPSPALRSQLKLYENEGLLVTEIVQDSPAEKAGFQQHDILLRAGDQRISTLEDLRACVNASKGEAVELTFMRAGKEQKLSATPERQPAPEFAVVGVCPRISGADLDLIYFAPNQVEQANETEQPTEESPSDD